MHCYSLPLITGGYVEPASLAVCMQEQSQTNSIGWVLCAMAAAGILAWIWMQTSESFGARTAWLYVPPRVEPTLLTNVGPGTPFRRSPPIPTPTPRPPVKHTAHKPPPCKHSEMDMEIKGLGAAFQAAKARIAHARNAVTTFEQTSAAFVGDIEDVTKQIDAMHSDLKFEATQLGNGGPTDTASTPSASSPVGAQPAEGAALHDVRAG